MATSSTIQRPVLVMVVVVAALIACHEISLVGAQLLGRPQVRSAQIPLQATQPPQVLLVQLAPQAAKLNVSTTMKPVMKLELSKVDLKSAVKIGAPANQSATSATAPSSPKPKNRMKIVKAADVKPSADDSLIKGFFSSLVNVDRAQNKSTVGVHIPLIFDMTNDKDILSGKTKLDLTVLSGMVTVNKDREKGKGPLTVTVFGIPVYSGTGDTGFRDLSSLLQSGLGEKKAKLDGPLEQVVGSRLLQDASVQLYSNIKRTGDKGFASITDSLDKVSSFLKERTAPISNTNGRPANKSDHFVTKPPQLRPEDLKPRLSETAFKKFATSNGSAHDLHLQLL